ncbi:MAG TPA: hypothetical protein VGJ92_10315 [Methanocella sp.]|jgi:uncharacterized membrane protein
MSGAGIVANRDRKPLLFVLLVTVALLFLASVPADAAAESTVHGSIYEWSTFSIVNNALVDVYSMPGHSAVNHYVARTGSYSFSLPEGDYILVATVGAGTPDEVTATENISVRDGGEHIIDLILFPSISLDDLSGFTENNTTPTLSPADNPTLLPNPTEQPSSGDFALWLGGGAIFLAIVAIVAGLILLRTIKPKKTGTTTPAMESPGKAEAVPPAMEPVEPPEEKVQAAQPPLFPQPSVQDLLLPEDCRQVLSIIEKNDGRITQLDLRKMLPYSEAKVSLIVSDLESRGLVKKIKKGRGNVLILNRPGDRER